MSLETDPLRRLRWQCRRGLLELDVLLGNFLETHYLKLSQLQQTAFVSLLQNTDQDLLYWFTEQTEPPAALAEILALIKKNK